MIDIIRSDTRGSADHGWLKARHTFSFANYYDPERVHFSDLRVINEDRIAPGQGFGTHPHKDMEIVTYIIDGAIEHKDSMGNGTIINAGEVQRMTAGTGVLHSEFNHSDDDELHLLQIWIIPEAENLAPGYEQTLFDREAKLNRLRLIGSRDGRDDWPCRPRALPVPGPEATASQRRDRRRYDRPERRPDARQGPSVIGIVSRSRPPPWRCRPW